MPRVLILTATVGEGHDLPARTLAAQLRAEHPGVDVITTDGLEPMGRVVKAVSADAPAIFFFRFEWMWDLGFWFFAKFGPTRRATQVLLKSVGGRGLLRLIDDVGPDVVVSTYPTTMEVLARLRRAGRIRIPVGSAITDLAAMQYWAPPGADFYLITHPQTATEVRDVAGPGARVYWVHGLTRPQFLVTRPARDARKALALPLHGKVILVSGGGWGVGDVEGAVAQALRIAEVSTVVCLCGRNAPLLLSMTQRFATENRVRVEGFTETMRDWLAAADVLVHSTGGLTVLEALTQGCPVISYGWGRGHLRVNNAAYRRFNLAEVVSDRTGLGSAIERAIRRPRPAPLALAELPSAASVVLDALE